MVLIACVDIRGGIAFNHRRQSRDSIVVADIIEMAKEARLFMTEYSARLFGDSSVIVSDDPARDASDGDFCFIELVDPTPFTDFASRLVLYNWNKRYPYDVSFALDESKWKLSCKEHLRGTSHDDIIKEIYER